MNAAWLIFLLVAGLFFEEPKRAPAPPLPRCAPPCGRAMPTAKLRAAPSLSALRDPV